jgi:predicted lipoprotein with Yx(FWY)xxD motif
MLRTFLLSAAASAVLFSLPATAQNRVDDPVSLDELLEEQLSAPYYGNTSTGYGRAQRPYIDKVPQLMLGGTARYTNVKYFRGIGKIMTDLQYRTVYATTRDTDFQVSSLSEADLEKWSPMVVSENATLYAPWGKAFNKAMNAWVLTFVDKPLYRFNGDEEPGQAKGDGGDFYKLEVIG